MIKEINILRKSRNNFLSLKKAYDLAQEKLLTVPESLIETDLDEYIRLTDEITDPIEQKYFDSEKDIVENFFSFCRMNDQFKEVAKEFEDMPKHLIILHREEIINIILKVKLN
jgi:hypothetical protein